MAPTRTCVGCRQRSPAPELLRVVMDSVAVDPAGGPGTGAGRLVPDPRRCLPGRGAHLHRTLGCLELAHRRGAFVRALRLGGAPDTAVVREYVEELERSGAS